jgi:hypothetical protein
MTERNSDVPIPNWLNVWSDEQISDWQQKDLDIKTILDLKSQFQNKPAKQF